MEAPPNPGVSNLTSTLSYGSRQRHYDDGRPQPGVSSAGYTAKTGSQDHIPEHLREEGDRQYAISHFPSMPIGLQSNPDEPVGYVVQIPLDKKAVASSRVRNGALPEAVYKKYEHFYKDEEKPVQKKLAQVQSADDLEIPDDDEPTSKFAAKTDQIGQLPPYDPAGSRQMTKKVNQPMTWETQQAKAGPGDVQARGDKNLYDTVKKTKVPWEQYKKASWVNPKVEKFAQAFGLDTAQLSSNQFWTDPDTDPLAIDLTLVGNFGKDWIDWEPETLWEMIGRIGGQNLAQEVKDKVQALKTMHAGDYFWEDEGLFEKVCLALNGIQPNFEERQNLNIPQIAKAISVSSRIKTTPFSDEVAAHIAAKAHQEGFLILPTMLAFAQPALSSLQTGLDALVSHVQKAYAARIPPGTGDDPLSVQLRKLYAVENYVAL
jgi:hypothetical protein